MYEEEEKKKKRAITTINITTHNNTAAGKRQITAKINNEEQDAPQRSLTIQFSYSNRFKFCPNNKVFHFHIHTTKGFTTLIMDRHGKTSSNYYSQFTICYKLT